MFELRWIERGVLPTATGRTGYYERVLQYRSAHWYLGADGNIHPGRDKTVGVAWGEWRDVPLKQENRDE